MSIFKKYLPKIGSTNLLNREQWLEKTLKQIPNKSKILDAGAGELKYKNFCSHLNYISQDFAQYDGKGDDIGLQTGTWDQTKLDIVSDIINIPVESETFDAILCVEVFEHLPDPISAIKEFSRILKSEGTVIITAPFCSITHFAPYHFYSGFNKYFYEHHLLNSGFKIIEISSNGNFFDYLAQELRRVFSVSEKYSNQSPKLIEKVAIAVILRFLTKSEKKDRGSNDLLNNGYHVIAQKI
ncbi:MAG: class I SAM-dependent methyltransferase [Saprospiraceae bacterium]|nr:class I SAM-dependent methyltransferase [Saprospiraceae bacterium]